jgi:hypothetical protein
VNAAEFIARPDILNARHLFGGGTGLIYIQAYTAVEDYTKESLRNVQKNEISKAMDLLKIF